MGNETGRHKKDGHQEVANLVFGAMEAAYLRWATAKQGNSYLYDEDDEASLFKAFEGFAKYFAKPFSLPQNSSRQEVDQLMMVRSDSIGACDPACG